MAVLSVYGGSYPIKPVKMATLEFLNYATLAQIFFSRYSVQYLSRKESERNDDSDKGVQFVTQPSQNTRPIEEKLREQQAFLERNMLTAVQQGRQTVADATQDVADQAVSSYQKELLFTQGTTGHNILSQIRLALERIDEGSYGECLHCGNTIGAKRLEAVPWTPYCIDCQEKIENGEIEDPVRAA
jgi:DnaK suppressor protein